MKETDNVEEERKLFPSFIEEGGNINPPFIVICINVAFFLDFQFIVAMTWRIAHYKHILTSNWTKSKSKIMTC